MGDIDVDDLLDGGGAGAHHDHAVGELHGFVDVVGDEDDGLALRLPDAQQFAAHDQAGDGIERAEGLVEEEHVGVHRQGARHFEPLLHAAGELGGIGLFKAFEADHLDVVGDALRAFRRGELEEAEADIAFDGEPGKDAALLEDEDAAGIGSGDYLAIDADLSAGGGEEAGHGAEQRRFAAAGGAEEADELSFGNFEVDVFEHGVLLPSRVNDHVDVLGAGSTLRSAN